MLFNSYSFPIFFIVVWGVYNLSGHRWQNILLLMASYFFYGCWDWRFLSLLLISTVVDYNCAKWIEKFDKRRRMFLLISLATNLGILGVFKYLGFFSESFAFLLSRVGLQADPIILNIILPVGISFYTFQTMSYTIDVYRGVTKPVTNLRDFALYVAYFPQLVAGPIERSVQLIPKLQKPRTLSFADMRSGCQLILMGYFKKVFIADGIAGLVERCFSVPENYGGGALVMSVYLFAIQIYCDFSGYTDIARGVSKLFGIDLCVNFRQPYLSSNITEFWRRWHISLSSWLRDYLYISLGGNRNGSWRTYLNNMITMLLGGLWHGAGWTFLIWGALHGVYLSIHKMLLRGKKVPVGRVPKGTLSVVRWLVGVVVTFNLVCFSWVFFRSPSLTDALHYLGCIGDFRSDGLLNLGSHLVFYGSFTMALDLFCFLGKQETPFSNRIHPAIRGFIYAGMLMLLIHIGGSNAAAFIYFQF